MMMQDTKEPSPKGFSKILWAGVAGILVVLAFLSGRYSSKFKPWNEDAQPRKSPGEMILQRMVLVPPGEFIMGTNKARERPVPASYGLRKPPYENEQPMRKVFLEAFYINKFEVTNVEYKQFVNATRAAQPAHFKNLDFKKWGMYPVVNLSWFEAERYCKWRGKRLPMEAEWEKAARGTSGRRFPWGNEYNKSKANNQQKGLAPVGFFKGDVSPYGAHDMAGNAAEWVGDWYEAYPGNEFKDPDYGKKYRVIRGSSWGGVGHYNLSYYARAAYRNYDDPTKRYNDIGFRCALSADSAKRQLLR
ncbi:MAG: formylglycine-generating enzyme family protein [Candidatus Binatia bacterium]